MSIKVFKPATLNELAPPTLMSLVEQILYFLWLARAEEAIELRPIVPAAIAILVRKDLRLTPEIESWQWNQKF
jgi:hypothetical protein